MGDSQRRMVQNPTRNMWKFDLFNSKEVPESYWKQRACHSLLNLLLFFTMNYVKNWFLLLIIVEKWIEIGFFVTNSFASLFACFRSEYEEKVLDHKE